MLLWLILACLTAIVLLVLLRPLARESEGDATEAASSAREGFDAAVYRDQLAEIDADRARGLIGEAEAEAARIEIARRLLATDGKTRASAGAQREGATSRAALIGVTALLPLLALGFYLSYGSPGLPDQPLALRLKDPANEQNIAALVARVEARLREHPEDGEGWDVIAPVYLGWRRYGDAANAYEQAIRLLGPSASRLSGLGQAVVLKNDGVVTEEARRALERALTLDKTLLEPRILLSIAKEQDGKFAEADRGLARAASDGRHECAVARDGRAAHRARRNQARREALAATERARRRRGGSHEPRRAPGDDREHGAGPSGAARDTRRRSARLAEARARL